MGRLTAELINRSPSLVNTLKQRELELRGILLNVIVIGSLPEFALYFPYIP